MPTRTKKLKSVEPARPGFSIRPREGIAIPPGLTSTTTPAGILAHDPDAIPPLTIDPEIRDLIEPLSALELGTLKQNIERDGCLDPLTGWAETGALLDGHNRKEICEAHKPDPIVYRVRWLSFADRTSAIDWVLAMQLGRRNISAEHRAYLIGKRLENETQPIGRPKGAQVEPLKNGHKSKGKTAERIAKQSNISAATVKRNGVFSKAVDALGGPKTIAGMKLIGGQVKMSDAAAAIVRKLPDDKLNDLASSIAGGRVKTVEQALVKAKLTPVQQKLARRETKAAKAETTRGVGETEFRETVLTRLRELQGLTCDFKAALKPVKQRVLELLTFVEAWV